MSGVLHHVEDVVHARDELVDVVAFDRRDEGLVEQFDGRLRNAVATLFDGLYVVAAALNIVESRHQTGEFVTGLENLFSVLDEEFEEAAFGGHQAGKHSGSSSWQRRCE